jgi:hypothetical protein
MRGKSHGRAQAVRRAGLALAGLAVLAAAPAEAATASALFYERSLMSAANGRCHLFTPEIGAALAASAAQARGAALRGGSNSAELAQVRARAVAKAGSLDCRSPDLAIAAKRVRSAFQAYDRLTRMTYQGDVANWRADRVQPSKGVSWRLAQNSRFGADTMTFGLAGPRGEPGALAAVVRFADGARPYAARLLIRDPARASEAYLNAMHIGASSRLPLAARTAPRNAVSAFLAETRAPADPALAGGEPGATLFRFPVRAAALIADLDPREAVTVEFTFSGRTGDVVRRAYVEVGDFATARAFLGL